MDFYLIPPTNIRFGIRVPNFCVSCASVIFARICNIFFSVGFVGVSDGRGKREKYENHENHVIILINTFSGRKKYCEEKVGKNGSSHIFEDFVEVRRFCIGD